MVSSAVLFLFSILIAVGSAEEEDKGAKIRYYRTIDDFEEIPLNSMRSMFNSTWYNSTRSTIIFSHGFTANSTDASTLGIMAAYLDQGESNVAVLNWQHLAADSLSTIPNSYLYWAVPNARQLGVSLAEALGKLSGDVDLSRLYLIGHSLGAHVVGIAGNNLRLNGILLPWIIGLDPAAPGFDKKGPAMRLNPNSAEQVTVIHSDPSKYGSKLHLGTVNFWPNFRGLGPVRQPGCGENPSRPFSREDLCSHHRSWELLIDAIKHPGTIIGSQAINYRIWKRYSVAQRAAVTMSIETYNKNALPGDYYFVTNAKSPYGLGEDGL